MRLTDQNETYRVLVGEKIDLATQTVGALFEALQKVFQQKDKPFRIQYTKGEPLLVERIILRPKEDAASILSPYEIIRNYAELRMLETGLTTLESLAVASSQLKGALNSIVVRDRFVFLSAFSHGIDPGKVLHIPIHEDNACPKDLFFVCASSTGRMLLDVDEAVACRLEET